MHIKRFFLISGVLSLSAAAALAATATIMSVQVNKAELRDAPSPFGKVVTSLAYGDKVSIQPQNGAWSQVNSSGQSGWLHNSALTKKTIVMKSGAGAQTSASSGEMALAGKGFNSDVEKQFKDNHKEINFAPVDKMEKIKIPVADIQEFAKEGKLQSAGGAK